MAKIGIFDSGVGGLSVFREIRRILPDEDYIYYSDSANCPYGDKSTEFILKRSEEITEFLISEGAQIIVIACNTATAAAIKKLRETHSIPFIGMEPAIKPAAAMTKTGIVGVLATSGTLKSEKYLNHKEKYASEIKISEQVGKGFVELVEKGILDGPEAEDVVRGSLTPLLQDGADTIVLGCTHYPFLSDTIRKTASEIDPSLNLSIVDPAPAIAKRVMEIIKEKGLPFNQADHSSKVSLHTSSDDKTSLEKIFRML